ncbi:MAG: EF-P beta-lysylation protein EpmB [Candidatus Muproteobacteria bacterium RBG_16_60_9]|uniref:L-lysine 2,3-aminomutase n=1 Tax=Candidatus Muproteobacteria bacterium RBG_16_60_9 TaxID=1817755 RepID=A0A1F6VDF3_9PROT|nr:MAG: EF-P beta-lysylation protein EpmB [Candidatus Muproteobacteria bacterium RBG_16_60_9]
MIPGTPHRKHPAAWQQELASALTDPAELIQLLRLDPTLIEPARVAARQFGLRVPRGYVARMRVGDSNDPLLRQVLPLAAEDAVVDGFSCDPVGDLAAMAVPGVLQKYQGRLLLTATGACAIHCRYCFRRHFPYADANPAVDGWQQAIDHIAADPSVHEVILSGGDPLTLVDAKLAALIDALAALPQVQRLRLHTRLPIVLPARVTDDLCAAIANTRLACVVVVHANHPSEIDAEVRGALARLRESGIALLNQSVLLRGVNDEAGILCALSEALFAAGALPYYLHQMDRVAGAAHFEVDDATAKLLWERMAARLPGYLVPRLVREEAGAPAKTIVR